MHGSMNFGGFSDYRILESQLPSGSPYFTYGNFMGAYTGSERWEGSSSGSLATFRHIGLHGHESFHVVGFVFCGIWQDQGKLCTGFSTGDWDTMHRTDPGPKRKGECLSHISAARKISAGWAVATDITANNMAENIQYINTQTDISPTATDFYRFTDAQSGEQFIIENRQYTGCLVLKLVDTFLVCPLVLPSLSARPRDVGAGGWTEARGSRRMLHRRCLIIQTQMQALFVVDVN